MKIIEYIKKYTLKETIKKLNLTYDEDDNLILLKYNQIKSDLRKDIVKEARSIIIEKNSLKVVSLPFKRFVSYSDTNADKVDWNNIRIQKKLDGSIIQLYYYNGWNVGTSGTLYGSGIVGQTNITFKELFMNIKSFDFNILNKNYVYIFELTTNKHTVVTKFKNDKITLLTVRNILEIDNSYYGELSRTEVEKIADKLNIDVIEEYKFKNLEEVLKSFNKLKFYDEGYVAVDSKFNRIKIKNPAWNAAHHNKGNKLNNSKLIDIIKSNEIVEFVEAYPNTKKVLLKLKTNYDKIINLLTYIKNNKNKLIGKELAIFIHSEISKNNLNKSLVGLCFSYINSDINDVYDFLNQISNKKILKYL